MKSVFASVAAALLLAGSSVAQLMVNTPLSVVQCQPILLSWTAGTPPYFLSIVPGNQPTAAALISFPPQTGLSLTWTANFTAGTMLGLDLRDNTGALSQSAPFTVQPGTDATCLTASGASSSSGATGATPPVSTPATTPATTPTTPATTPPATTPTTPATTSKPATSSSGTATKPSTTPSSAATGQNLNVGFAGVLGAALVALLA